jgi:hypothetical protein
MDPLLALIARLVTSRVAALALVAGATFLPVTSCASAADGDQQDDVLLSGPAELRFVSRPEIAEVPLRRADGAGTAAGQQDDGRSSSSISGDAETATMSVGVLAGGIMRMSNNGGLTVVEDKYLSKLSPGEDLGIGILMTCIGES